VAEQPPRESPEERGLRVYEFTLGHVAWYWIHKGQGKARIAFSMENGRLLRPEDRKCVGLNLFNVDAREWASGASGEDVAAVRTIAGATSATIELLERLPGVEALECSGLTNRQIAWLPDVTPRLKLLHLGWSEPEALDALARLSSLQFLILADCNRLADLGALASLSQLMWLQITNCDLVRDLSPLSHLKRLRRLVLCNCAGISDLAPVGHLTALTSLNLWGSDGVDNLRPLSSLKRLRSLDLSRCNRLTSVAALQSMESLRHLVLSGCDRIEELSPIYRLRGLRRIGLPPSVTDQDLRAVSSFHPHLTELDLRACANISDLGPLAALRKLTRLSLARCVNVSDLRPLSALEDLRRLDLAYCTKVTDLRPLHGLKGLRELYLDHCAKLPPAEIVRFRKACPQCEVSTG